MTTNPHEALLEHRTFLLRLARSLVRDESTAQDLVQEASAAYLEAPPREPGASKAWLALVVRRLAGKGHRSRARLAERETAAARPESEPSGIEALDRQLDMQSVLIELVKELPVTQREAVQLRYHGDMAPKAIAQQLGVSVSTVNTRLQRALASLRTSMDRRSGGERDLWASALLGVVPGSGVVAASVPVATAGWTPWFLGAVAGTAALAALYVGLSSSSESAPSPVTIEASLAEAQPDPMAPVPASTNPRSLANNIASVTAVSTSAAQSQDTNWLVPVTISGDGVSAKPTRLYVKGVMDNINWSNELEVLMEAPGAGTIDLHELVSGSRRVLSKPVTGIVVRVEHPDCPSQTLTFAISPISNQETAPADPTEAAIELPLSSVVAGQVTFADQAAILPTRIFAFPMADGAEPLTPMRAAHIGEATVNSEGQYRLRMTHDGSIAMVFIAKDHRPETRIVAVDRGETRTLSDVLLSTGPVLEGQLTWAGNAVPLGTRISVRAPGGGWGLPSDGLLTPFRLSWENQRFETAAVQIQTNIAGRFKHSGLGNRPVDLSLNDLRPFAAFMPMPLAESVSAPADLTLELDAAILELSFDFAGERVTKGHVQGFVVAEDDDGARVNQWIHAGDSGRMAAPLGKEVELTAHVDGFEPTTVLARAPGVVGETLPIVFAIRHPQQASRLDLQLTIDGVPLADGTSIQLKLCPSGSIDRDNEVHLDAVVANGVASFDALPNGSFEATAYPGRSRQWRSTHRADASFEVELEPQRTLEMSQALAPGGRALFTARATSGRLVGMQWKARVLDASSNVVPGHFRTMKPGGNTVYGGWTAHGEAGFHANLLVGTYTLELRHPEYAPVNQAFTVRSDTTTRVEVALVAGSK